MIRNLCLGLLLSTTVVWGQPVEGPFEIMLIDSGVSFTTPQITIADSVTAHIYCTISDSVARRLWRFIYNFEFFVTDNLEELYVSAGDSLTVGDAESSAEGDAILFLEKLGDSTNVRLTRYDEDGLHHDLIYAGHFWGNWAGSYDYVRPLQPSLRRLEHGWGAAWTIHWVNSIGWCIQFMNYPAIAIEDSTGNFEVTESVPEGWSDEFESVSLFPHLVKGSSDTIYVIGHGHETQIQPMYVLNEGPLWQYLYPVSCDLSIRAFEQTHGGQWLAYSGLLWNQPNAQAARITLDGSCDILSSVDLPGNPSDVAWHPDYGFAAVYASPNALELVRVDTNSVQTLPAGTLFWRDSLHTFVDASVAITDSGKIVVVWTEKQSDEPTARRLMLATVGWDTPLSVKPSDFVPHPSSFILSVYPNPFNSELQIQYDLPRAGDVELKVFNVLGQKVAELESGMQSAGAHRALWSPQEGSGIYFVQIKMGNQVRTQKVLLAR